VAAAVNIEMANIIHYFRSPSAERCVAASKIKQLKSSSGCLLILIFSRFLWRTHEGTRGTIHRQHCRLLS